MGATLTAYEKCQLFINMNVPIISFLTNIFFQFILFQAW